MIIDENGEQWFRKIYRGDELDTPEIFRIADDYLATKDPELRAPRVAYRKMPTLFDPDAPRMFNFTESDIDRRNAIKKDSDERIAKIVYETNYQRIIEAFGRIKILSYYIDLIENDENYDPDMPGGTMLSYCLELSTLQSLIMDIAESTNINVKELLEKEFPEVIELMEYEDEMERQLEEENRYYRTIRGRMELIKMVLTAIKDRGINKIKSIFGGISLSHESKLMVVEIIGSVIGTTLLWKMKQVLNT